MKLEDYKSGDLKDIISPYHDGNVFTNDFWMDDRIGAQKGASVEMYYQVTFYTGATGIASARGPENIVVKAGTFDRWNDATTSPGDIGWNPRGAEYRYDYAYDQGWNHHVWIDSGCPRVNAYGEWANGGLPLEYVKWTWEHPTTRGPSPMPRRYNTNRHK